MLGAIRPTAESGPRKYLPPRSELAMALASETLTVAVHDCCADGFRKIIGA
jgi:hypothetical protein